MVEEESVTFTVVWEGKTKYAVDQIIPKMEQFSHTLDGFEKNKFRHLTVVIPPPAEAEVEPDVKPEVASTECATDIDVEPMIIQEPVVDEPIPTEESPASTESSVVPNCGSECDVFVKREREIEDVLPMETIILAGADCVQMFEQFEEEESSEVAIAPDSPPLYEDKAFRFAVYDKAPSRDIRLPSTDSDSGSSASSGDEVDIPINQNEEVEIADRQLEDALIAADDGGFDVSLEDIPSENDSSDNGEHPEPSVEENQVRNETFEFEYENQEKNDQPEVKGEETLENTPTEAPVDKPEPTPQQGKAPWDSDDDRKKEEEPTANITFVPNSGDIRERGITDSRTNAEIRSDMDKEKNAYRPPPRRSPHHQQQQQSENFTSGGASGRDRNTKTDEWEVASTNENRTRENPGSSREFNSSNREGYENRNHQRRFEGNNRRNSDAGYNREFNSYRENNRRPYNNDGDNHNWGGNNNRTERRYGGDGGGAGSREHWGQGGRSGAYNQGTPTRRPNNYNSDNSEGTQQRDNTKFYRENRNQENGNFNRERADSGQFQQNQAPGYDGYGNRQRSNNDYNRNNNNRDNQHHPRGEAHNLGPIGPNNNRDRAAPEMAQRKQYQNRSFQSDHCNRDDFNGQTKQINDESFGGMRSERKTTNREHNPEWDYNPVNVQQMQQQKMQKLQN